MYVGNCVMGVVGCVSGMVGFLYSKVQLDKYLIDDKSKKTYKNEKLTEYNISLKKLRIFA